MLTLASDGRVYYACGLDAAKIALICAYTSGGAVVSAGSNYNQKGNSREIDGCSNE